jgi:hypothetical protein
LFTAAPVTPEFTVSTGKLLDGPPPATVTMLVVFPLMGRVSPSMAVFDGMVSPLPSVIVCGEEKSFESN